ncbi:MAG: hypothetical protein A2001_19075 [Treponema sp. GWC1_61_84]|nr:MAG: hypothetical protein A2001_19075 [Treponema sp. GWC1_61_84]
MAKNLVATPGGRSMTLTWDAVATASGYTVWYNVDGSTPTTSSTSVNTTVTTLTQTGPDETKTYKYSVQPTANGYDSPLIAPVMAQPLNVITFTIGQAGENQAVVIQPYYAANAATSEDWTNAIYTTGTPIFGTADANGALTLVLTINRINQWGWTVVLDNDGSHTINTGDTVWGSDGEGTLVFRHYTAAVTSSTSRTYNPWSDQDNTGSNGTSLFY